MNERTDIQEKCERYARDQKALVFRLKIHGKRDFPDTTFFLENGATLIIEFKTPKGNLRENQQLLIETLRSYNQNVFVICDVPTFRRIFDSYNEKWGYEKTE